ncbi:MAG TPA: Nramp family divalent metal transporter [Wenzhouxiangellaceae bacterium]|nr:Nramp family divalent metal transporter [Wenzhouxiangellaceae bacterium]
MKPSTLRNAIGPGLLMAGAAVGVSHLVQSTRAGAEYGLALLGLVLLGCALKYPFLEFGPRYAAATGEHMIRGYRRLGKWPLGLFAFLTLATMFIVLASVTIVTAGLAGALLGLDVPIAWLAFFVLSTCALILTIGNYRGLDFLMKIIMAVLSLATLFAVALAAGQRPEWSNLWPSLSESQLLSGAGLAFALALLGWMPIPLDAAAWHSLWTLERARETGSRPSVAHASADFRIGYIGAVVLAVAFMLLGALVMHGGNQEPASSAVGFSTQLIAMYTDAMGAWARPLIAFAALATMLSTTLAVADAYPRALRAFLELGDPCPETQQRKHRSRYLAGMLLTMFGAWLIIALVGRHFTLLIDFTTTVAFLTAPVIAWLNLKLLTGPHTPPEARPGPLLYWTAQAGLVFLALFSIVWIGWRISTF